MGHKKISPKNTNASTNNQPDLLIKDISALIDEARSHVAREYNSTQALSPNFRKVVASELN